MLRLLLSLPVRVGLTVFLGILFAFLCFHYEWFALIDLKIYDLGLNVRSQTESQSEVVIIAIDRYSRENCFQPPHFPISNHIYEHSRVIDRLSGAGAKVIAIDILFDQLDPKLDLTPFVSALANAENVILAGVIESQSLRVAGTSTSIQEERVILPSPGIPSSLYEIGLVNLPVGPDQVGRQSYYGKEFQGKWYLSLPTATVAAFLREEAPEIKTAEPFYIDYSPPKGGFATIPYADVLEKEGWQNSVEGRIALIGVTENGLSDTHKSPVSDLPGAAGSQKLPGVFFLAHAAETLLRNNMITMLPRPLSLLLCILLILGSSFLALGKRLILNMVLMIILTMVVLICGIALVASNITILPTGKLVAVWLVTGAIGMLISFSYTKLKFFEQARNLSEISSDLKMAKQIQQKLQPETIPVMKEVEISGLQIPCKEIGGDYYDVITVSNRRVALLIADVSGKGISGALIMSNFQSAVHSLAPKILSPAQLLAELNVTVSKIVSAGRFVTFFYGILDLDTKKFTYCNAGHTYPILCRANGKINELSEGGLFLGPFPQATWRDSEVQLESGDLLFLYTDGITEAADKKTDEQFGEKRLTRFLEKNFTQRPETINQQLVKTLESFTDSEQFEDDITLLTLKIL